MEKPTEPANLTDEAIQERTKKAENTRLANLLQGRLLNAARDKDWTAVTIISGTIYILTERGEL